MANLGKVVYLSEQQKKELFANNTITVDGVTINYSDNDIYATPGNESADTSLYCTATLSSSGWYRILETPNVSGSIIHVFVCVEAVAEVHEIDFCVSVGVTKFTNELSVGNYSFVDKIRFTTKNTTLYIDIHYNSSTAKTVNVNFEVFGYAQLDNTTAESLQLVADTPSGETVATTYNFALSTYISSSIAGSYGTIYYDRKGDVCSIYGDVTGVPTGAWTTLATGLPAPARTQFFTAQNGASSDSIMCQINTSGTLKFYGRGSYSSGYPTWTYVCN